MNPDFQRRVQRYGWTRAASYYDRSWKEQLQPAQDRVLEWADLQPGDRVLDVACGTGLVTRPAADAVGPEGTVVATDLSEGMLDLGREAARKRGVTNVSFAHMDAEDLDVPDRAFDVALCSLGLMYVPDPDQALQEMHRSLAPGGRIAVAVWGRRSQCGWADVFPIMDRRVKSEVCPLFFQLGTGDRLAETMRSSGFVDVEMDRFPVSLDYETSESACEAAFWGGAVALAWRKFDEEQRKGARAEYLTSIEPYRNGDGGYAIPGEFVVARGVRPTAGSS
mgnify:CR=1 FL=1